MLGKAACKLRMYVHACVIGTARLLSVMLDFSWNVKKNWCMLKYILNIFEYTVDTIQDFLSEAG